MSRQRKLLRRKRGRPQGGLSQWVREHIRWKDGLPTNTEKIRREARKRFGPMATIEKYFPQLIYSLIVEKHRAG